MKSFMSYLTVFSLLFTIPPEEANAAGLRITKRHLKEIGHDIDKGFRRGIIVAAYFGSLGITYHEEKKREAEEREALAAQRRLAENEKREIEIGNIKEKIALVEGINRVQEDTLTNANETLTLLDSLVEMSKSEVQSRTLAKEYIIRAKNMMTDQSEAYVNLIDYVRDSLGTSAESMVRLNDKLKSEDSSNLEDDIVQSKTPVAVLTEIATSRGKSLNDLMLEIIENSEKSSIIHLAESVTMVSLRLKILVLELSTSIEHNKHLIQNYSSSLADLVAANETFSITAARLEIATPIQKSRCKPSGPLLMDCNMTFGPNR